MNEEELRHQIMRQKGTERPFTGKHLNEKRRGIYRCAACGRELFSSESKFNSGCGWPSFDRTASEDAVESKRDLSHFMVRTEILCKGCGGHLGHVFDDGPTQTGKRYCINSVALEFEPEQKE